MKGVERAWEAVGDILPSLDLSLTLERKKFFFLPLALFFILTLYRTPVSF